jgi:ATP-dependent DNA ligase
MKWTFEIKFDGYRCVAVKRGREVTLFSRNKKVLNKRLQKVVEALASLGGDFVLDGELVAFDPQGRPSFQLLQNTRSRSLPVYFYAFDLLNRDGELLVNLPFARRRELLESLLIAPEDPLRLSSLCAVNLWQASIAICLTILGALNPYVILGSCFLFKIAFAFGSPTSSSLVAEMISKEEFALQIRSGGLQINV